MNNFWRNELSAQTKIHLVLIGLCVSGFYGAVYFFSVPDACICRASVPGEFSNELFLENSLGDANTVIISIPAELEICYSKMPMKGKVTGTAGLNPKSCEFGQSSFEFEELGERHTDIEATLAYRIKYRPFTIFRDPNAETSTSATIGRLHANRQTNACTFEALRDDEGKLVSSWGGKKLTGNLECSGTTFYFNPWSWFPQTVELFYTRAFYHLHKT